MKKINKINYKKTLSKFPTGVTVIAINSANKPIGKTVNPKVEVIRKINVGFRTASDLGFASNSNAERKVAEESLMLSGDQNIADVQFTVLFKIKDA